MKPCTCPQDEQDSEDYEDSDTGKFEMFFKQTSMCFTGKSFSEALILSWTNPQYDKRLFIELQIQYIKIPSSEHYVHRLFW